MYFGGNSEMRGYDYLEFLGHKAFFLNAELRFPIIEAALTPLGVVGGLRGVFFANFGGAGFQGQPMKLWTSDDFTFQTLLGFDESDPTNIRPIIADVTVPGFKLVNSRASYGIGLETFALGFPVHFDWSWRTLFNKDWEDVVYFYRGALEGQRGSEWLRKPKFTMWIGYDF
jgi:outer membrane protein assembly factor BamA